MELRFPLQRACLSMIIKKGKAVCCIDLSIHATNNRITPIFPTCRNLCNAVCKAPIFTFHFARSVLRRRYAPHFFPISIYNQNICIAIYQNRIIPTFLSFRKRYECTFFAPCLKYSLGEISFLSLTPNDKLISSSGEVIFRIYRGILISTHPYFYSSCRPFRNFL